MCLLFCLWCFKDNGLMVSTEVELRHTVIIAGYSLRKCQTCYPHSKRENVCLSCVSKPKMVIVLGSQPPWPQIALII